jgi:hypothetical protein
LKGVLSVPGFQALQESIIEASDQLFLKKDLKHPGIGVHIHHPKVGDFIVVLVGGDGRYLHKRGLRKCNPLFLHIYGGL